MMPPIFAAVVWRGLLFLVMTLIGLSFPVGSLSAAQLDGFPWVGMFPGGYSEHSILAGQSFNIYTQVYREGVTEPLGQGADISCSVAWSEVDRFGGPWIAPTDTPMIYTGDIGNNDEYQLSLIPKAGRYEYTAYCTQLSTQKRLWYGRGNGRLTVKAKPTDQRAFWIEQSVIAWNMVAGNSYELHYNLNGNLMIPPKKGRGIPLTLDQVIFYDSYPKFPNIGGYSAWRIPLRYLSFIPDILKGEMAIAAYDRNGNLLDATGIQIQGVLDDLYSYSGELGVIFNDHVPTLKLWAPTAKSVILYRFADANTSTAPILSEMTLDPSTGVWSITGDESWQGQYYRYEVEVYMGLTGQIEHNLITDPYSVSLAQNSRLSQIIDLYEDPSLKPLGWDTLVKPTFTVPEDMAIYEVHVRDFSRDDETVAQMHRGTFKAFTYDGQEGHPPRSNGMTHLINLAQAGLTHIHLLPVFDFTSVNEDVITRTDPDYQTLSGFNPNSDRQQAIIAVTRGNDSFNWGYDPYHYGVPEGSYATNAQDTSRILEFREMVKSLSDHGLRVAMDMVYNHTFASRRYSQSVLDMAVPGYYYRYTNTGIQHNSSCCPDTAAEFSMMQKLMVDTLVRWAKAYKVDSFRFDLMNLHPVDTMVAIKRSLESLTLERDGVDGRQIYLYGEGWDFGSAKDKGLRVATQYNMAGTGIGTFNDKLRDSIHGGYSQDFTTIHRQGFVNGQSYDWNGYFYPDRFKQESRYTVDRVRVGLAGSLQNYLFTDQTGGQATGIRLNGTGYTLDPQETINYVSKHDNETLYDLNIYKLPLGEYGMATTTMEERVRVQNLALSLVTFSQGLPFYHMGSDMLRSKSLDRNSYDSGDWFNRVDFSYTTNHFGIGLPPAWDNRPRWPIMSPLLDNANLRPNSEHILDTVTHLQEVLKIRKNSKLFRMETAADIMARVKFYNVGPNQRDGLIVMVLTDTVEPDLDPNVEAIVVFFNVHKITQGFTISEFAGQPISLHPVQLASRDEQVKLAQFDPTYGSFTIPPRTAAVFVLPQAK